MVSSDDAQKTRNIHIDVTAEFHKELKMMCAFLGVTLKEYAVAALRDRLKGDQERAVQGKAKTASTAP